MEKDALDAREARFLHHRELARHHGVITLGLCLPGGSSRYGFAGELLMRGSTAIRDALASTRLKIEREETYDDAAGPGWMAVVSGASDRAALKKRMTQVEEGDPSGRLWDIDVLREDGSPVDRLAIGAPPRRCYICDLPAHECRLAGRHPREELIQSTESLWLRHIEEEVASTAIAATLLEAATTPSPGLVNPVDSGSHEDMNYMSFLLSTSAISAGFHRLAFQGANAARERLKATDLSELMPSLRSTGVEMEKKMLMAAHANTHRGLIFTLGTASAAAAYVWARKSLAGDRDRPLVEEVCAAVSGLTRGITASARATDSAIGIDSRGRRLLISTGLRGVRGEVEDGFPTVREYGYPAFQYAISRVQLADALVHTLITLIAHTEDSALAGRHSPEVLSGYVRPEVKRVLASGGVFTAEGREGISRLAADFRSRRLNPGGSADLLAVTIALYMWSNGGFAKEKITGKQAGPASP